MTDYGHDLTFGAFITPTASNPQEPVRLAQAAEAAGLDLVTFQDHPYNAQFVDTWTLMSWVAAATERVTVAGNVLNLPLRPPAVLARAAASLDLLSSGRVAMGLGAGGMWDAIVTMGAQRLTPGESIDSLSEAIDVMRELWNTRQRGMVRLDGEHHQVVGARRGPAPAHDIPIWIGAYKPRMLRLTARKGDGWLPSLPYLKDGDLERGNRIIDEAAEEAGRHPAQIRRMLNIGGAILPSPQGQLQGPVDQWIDELTEFAIEHGVATFIAMGDDPTLLATFGEEIAPAVRENVAAERRRAGTVPAEARRGTAALSLRREHIDYDAIPASLLARAVEPGDKEYDTVRHNYLRSGAPGLVLRPRNAEEVREALLFARRQPVPLAVRSAGHGISGRSTNDGGIVIDVGALDGIELLDEDASLVRAGAGATWGQIAGVLTPRGRAITSGDYGGVGVGGLATTGGIGLLGRRQGLTIDRVRAYEVVTADGELVRASAEENTGLYWAMRGAGGNFGIVTAVELEPGEVGNVIHSVMTLSAQDPVALLQHWGAVLEGAPRELTSNLFLGGNTAQGMTAQLMTVWANEDSETAMPWLEQLAGAGQLLSHQGYVMPYSSVVQAADAHHTGGGDPYSRSGLLTHLDTDTARAISRLAESGASNVIAIRATGGAAADVDPQATAYAHRHQNFSLAAMGGSADRLNSVWDTLILPAQDGSYLSFSSDTRPERLSEAFPEPTLGRLRRLKHEWDPDNVFNANFPIAPELS
ncbi:LLM class flavin-dependent oxidoreductase [Bogoriella caseilytica]|uniref:FAD/FMN-containing dehydrogenase n=1 Tax=Bogoriella caseilytica TaxID=56055 RepID=A0A3N2BCU9_9MICO|nr:LLM class flavin-dependent oxidoreductase [Bogoriella caseilytica]ROR73077.1 FAD/FMN-containing dehydrogenase [Bogoriella caseilytica]